MSKAIRLFLILGLLAGLSLPVRAQLWSGFLKPTYGPGNCTLLPTSTYAGCAIDWTTVGVGGIPARNTISTTINASTCSNGSVDCTPTIQAALNAAATETTVLLSAGTFRINNQLIIPSHVTLRGAGHTTILSGFSSGKGMIVMGTDTGEPTAAQNTLISSGASAGSTSLVVTSASGMAIGNYMLVTELNYEPAFTTYVTTSGGPGGGNCTFCGLYGFLQTRVRGQIVEITGVSGTTISFTPPLYTDYLHTLPNWTASRRYGYAEFITSGGHIYEQTATQASPGPYFCVAGGSTPAFSTSGGSVTDGTCTWLDFGTGSTSLPGAVPFAAAAKYAGLENLTLYANNTGYNFMVHMSMCAYCWERGTTHNYTDGDHTTIDFGYRDEIRDNYFSNAFLHTSGTYADSALQMESYTSQTLLENNILERLHVGVLIRDGAAGDVVGYNYMLSNFDGGSTNVINSGVDNHTTHPQFILYEGNVVESMAFDSTWGSSSHGTLYRNWTQGYTKICNPTTAGRATVVCTPFGTPGGSGINGWYSYQANRSVGFDYPANYYNVINNVNGSAAQLAAVTTSGATPPQLVLTVAPTSRNYDGSYDQNFGYSGTSDGGGYAADSAFPYTTALLHGNYTNKNSTILYVGGLPTSFPASFYHASKPIWWTAAVPYPAIGGDVTGGTGPGGHASLSVSNPAQYCYITTMGGSDGGPGTPLAFDSSTCYSNASVPNLLFSPNPANFGTQNMGVPVGLTITVTNNGTANQVMGSPYSTITGTNAADFANLGTGTCANGATITPTNSCTVNMTFTPSFVGVESASLNISGTASGADVLTGTGTSGSITNPPAFPLVIILAKN